ncbi:MAG TPA: peptidase domain-containing ABC transporter [Puia sp.]|nr:peptidase domain-containing ABC transporter [Puia sp.]
MKNFILIKQRDAADCGAACLASVSSYYGLHLPVSRIRQYAGTGKHGTSLYGLIEAAGQLRFRAKGVRTTGHAITQIRTPAIFHLVQSGLQHFVVIYKITNRYIWFMDPAFGKMIRDDIQSFNRQWSGIVLLLMPSDEFRQLNEKESAFVKCWQMVRPHRKVMVLAILLSIIYAGLGFSTSFYILRILDVILPGTDRNLLKMLGLVMILLYWFRFVAGYLKSMIALRTGQRMDRNLILGYYRHLLNMPQRFFDSMRTGELVSRVNDAMRIRAFINDIALGIIVNIFVLLLSLTLMFILHWQLAFLCMLSIPFYFVIYSVNNSVNAKWQRKIMKSGAALENHLMETIQGVSTIRRFGKEDFFYEKMENKYNPLMQSVFISSRNSILISHLSEWITGLLMIILLWNGANLVMGHELLPGELISFFTIAAFFAIPVQALIQANKPFQDALIAADRLFEITDLETENNESHVIECFPEGDLVFKNVHFSYGPGTVVFKGQDIRLPMGQITAVIGESGSGKSTLVSLIQKLYVPDGGKIMIGDMDIQNLSTGILRKNIAAVQQHIDLFEGDFVYNIALGEQAPDLNRIYEICLRLGLHSFTDQLPDRYQTIIREQGVNLSGGQKQRIGIARALYKDPQILILDEATSALDSGSEKKVLDTLRWFYNQKKTIIVIAHRLSTIRQCDSIICLRHSNDAIPNLAEEQISDGLSL